MEGRGGVASGVAERLAGCPRWLWAQFPGQAREKLGRPYTCPKFPPNVCVPGKEEGQILETAYPVKQGRKGEEGRMTSLPGRKAWCWVASCGNLWWLRGKAEEEAPQPALLLSKA